MRAATAVILVTMTACADRNPVTDSDLHRVGACDASWSALWQDLEGCEDPCSSIGVYTPGTTTSDSDACVARILSVSNRVFFSSCLEKNIFTYDGVSGCCERFEDYLGGPLVRFAVCVEDL